MTDEELLTKYLTTKEAKYFDAFDRRMRPRIYKLALKLLRSDESSADDITQDVLLKLMMLEPRTFEPPVSDFVFAITRNLCKNFFRDEKSGIRRDAVSLDVILQNERSHGSDPDYEGPSKMEKFDEEEPPFESPSVKLAVENLSTDLKNAVYLRFAENMTVRESAKSLGIKPSATKVRVHRALNLLRQDIGGNYATA